MMLRDLQQPPRCPERLATTSMMLKVYKNLYDAERFTTTSAVP
jgi:hypothetical protein